MKSRFIGFALGAAVFAGWASSGAGQGGITPSANVGEVVAAELGFARLAKEEGQWTAFAAYATKDAILFVPEPVRAQQWLKGRKNPERTVEWQPSQVWSSCDGSIAVTKGPWTRPDGSVGYFTTIWQRQQKGEYKWVLDQGDTLAEPLAEADLVQADIADCTRQRGPAAPPPPGSKPPKPPKRGEFRVAPVAADGLSGSSVDGTLSWSAKVAPDTSRELRVHLRKGDAMQEVLTSLVAAPAG